MQKFLATLMMLSALCACSCGQKISESSTSSSTVGHSISDAVTSSDLNDKLQNQIGNKVYFALDSSALTTDAKSTLNKQAEFIKQNPGYTFQVQGHADERGTGEYNLALGERRASAVKNYLVQQGVEDNRVSTLSFGKERPEVIGHSEDAWQKNRRAVTITTEMRY
jgi:peptidoglycan-associated lipoprotein